MKTNLLKEAAVCLEDSKNYIDELEAFLKRAELIEKVAFKLKERLLVSDLDQYFEKVSELKTKGFDELESMNTYLEVYAPKAQVEFGKLAEYSPKDNQHASAEEQFTNIIMGGINL